MSASTWWLAGDSQHVQQNEQSQKYLPVFIIWGSEGRIGCQCHGWVVGLLLSTCWGGGRCHLHNGGIGMQGQVKHLREHANVSRQYMDLKNVVLNQKMIE